MIRIAILGDIGAGKSFVSKQFNCPLFNADKEVAEIYKNDRSCYQKIKKALPKYIISDYLDKKFLLKAVSAESGIETSMPFAFNSFTAGTIISISS